MSLDQIIQFVILLVAIAGSSYSLGFTIGKLSSKRK